MVGGMDVDVEGGLIAFPSSLNPQCLTFRPLPHNAPGFLGGWGSLLPYVLLWSWYFPWSAIYCRNSPQSSWLPGQLGTSPIAAN